MSIVDQYGREIKTNRPITDDIAGGVYSVRDRYSTYPSQGLTPQRLAAIFREADQGGVSRQAELFEEIEEKDCHLGGIMQSRRLAVSGLEMEILPASDSSEDKKIAEAATEMIEYIENWDDAVQSILDAVGKGFSVQEMMWEMSERMWWPVKLEEIHQKRFTFNTEEKLLNYPRLLTESETVYGEELPPNKFVVHISKARSGATSRGGLLRPCSYMYLFKNYDLKDWLIFNELFSVPMRVGKYQAGATADEKETLKQAVYNLGVDAAAVISDSTIIELIESKRRGDAGVFRELIDFCEKSMTKSVLGHTGSSDSTPGKLGSEDMARELRQDLKEADAKALEKTIKFQILMPWVIFNYGADKGIPKVKLHYEAPEDTEKAAKVYGHLVKDVGFKNIGIDHLHEKFGIPVPKKGEQTLADISPSPLPGKGKQMANKSMINSSRSFTPNQQALEELADKVVPGAAESLEDIEAKIVDAVMAAESYEEAFQSLLDIYPEMDMDGFMETAERALLNAELFGRYTEKEAHESDA